jgi:hypothetical protein
MPIFDFAFSVVGFIYGWVPLEPLGRRTVCNRYSALFHRALLACPVHTRPDLNSLNVMIATMALVIGFLLGSIATFLGLLFFAIVIEATDEPKRKRSPLAAIHATKQHQFTITERQFSQRSDVPLKIQPHGVLCRMALNFTAPTSSSIDLARRST